MHSIFSLLHRHAGKTGFVVGFAIGCQLIAANAPSFFTADNVQLLYRVNVADRYREQWEAAERDLAAMRRVYGYSDQ